MKDAKNCSGKQYAISVIAVFAFLFLYDWLVHGVLLMDMYRQIASISRPEGDMQTMLPLCILYHLLLAAVLTCLFSSFQSPEGAAAGRTKEAKNRSRGLSYGTHIGIILGLVHAAAYIWLPVPAMLAGAWFAAGVLQGLGTGLVLSWFSGLKTGK